VLAGTLGYAWRIYRQPYLGAWSVFWALYAFVWILLSAAAGLLTPGTAGWLAVETVAVAAALAARLAVAVGTAWYLGRSLPRRPVLVGASLAVLALAGLDVALRALSLAGQIPWLATLPFRSFSVGAVGYAALAVAVWRGSGPFPAGARQLLGLALAGAAASDLWDVALDYLWAGAASAPAAGLSALGGLAADTLLAGGMLVAAVGTERDRAEAATAELRRRDAQLQRAQRLESIGQLAGGLAHDFNNLLTAIVANLSVLRDRIPPGDEAREDVEAAQIAAERATRLTRQLLTFARRQAVEPRIVDLNDTITGFSRMIGPLVGERIALRLELGEGLWPARIDPAQFEQLLLNFVMNARDAMPAGGQLTVSTANVLLDGPGRAPEEEGVPPGEWVRLAVDDTGQGIEPGLQQRIFEPFFTTKPTGRGSGLGLATVLGIAQAAGGHVGVRSAPGAGSRFALFLPRQGGLAEEEESPVPRRARGTETILVVEDDPLVRTATSRILGSRGYRVLQAANGREALAVASRAPRPIDMLVTDVVMPEMGGRELARELLRRDPRLPVLLVSGYASGGREAVQDAPLPFLPKPFTPEQIADRVRQLIDGRPAA
jgi:signal transduction histidine kinase/CheY-like chemotaxis protein